MESNKIAVILALAAYTTGTILQLGNSTIENSSTETINYNIEAASEQVYDDVDNFLVQLLIQSRYNTATSVVWVYGCADKT